MPTTFRLSALTFSSLLFACSGFEPADTDGLDTDGSSSSSSSAGTAGPSTTGSGPTTGTAGSTGTTETETNYGETGDTSDSTTGDTSGPPTTDTTDTTGVGEGCTADTFADVVSVFSTLSDTEHPCYGWVDATHGRVLRNGFASGVIWSRNNDHEVGLLMSAVHVLGGDWWGPSGVDLPREYFNPTTRDGVMRLTLISPDGAAENTDTSLLFDIYHPAISAAENVPGFADILPRNDVFVGLVDAQLFDGFIGSNPLPLQHDPLPLYDPLNLTTTSPTIASVSASGEVLVVGFPADGPLAGDMAYAVGSVLSDAEAEDAITALAANGDEEGNIAYDPEAEFLLRGHAYPGMSGGGAFDADGRLVGVLVRGSDTEVSGSQIVRISRADFAAERFTNDLEDIDAALAESFQPYLEPS
jgi:hypothetical protein